MPLTSRTLPVRGLACQLHTAGPVDAPIMLFMHGLLDTGTSFAPLIRALQQLGCAHYCIAPDWRGHGASDRAHDDYWFPDYLADLEALITLVSAQQPIVLVGHSMGGQIASMYAGIRPQTVSHLITLDSLNLPDAPVAQTAQRYRDWLDALRGPQRRRRYPSLDQLANRIARRYPELDTQTRLFLAANWSRQTPQGDFELTFDTRHFRPFPYGFRLAEAKALWREVRAHTLCIDAENSSARERVTATDMAERRACFAHVERATVADCGHMLHVQAPSRVAGLVHDFMTTHDTPR